MFCLGITLHGFTQSLSVGLGYANLQSTPWNKAIDVYNFSRPGSSQPYFEKGISGHFTYCFQPKKPITQTISLAYGNFSSSSTDQSFTNLYHFQWLNAAFGLQWNRLFKLSNFNTQLQFGALATTITRSLNGTTYFVDGTRLTAWGIAPNFSLQMAYNLPLTQKLKLSPFIKAAYAPYVHSPNAESVLNQTKGVTGAYTHALVQFLIGVQLDLMFK